MNIILFFFLFIFFLKASFQIFVDLASTTCCPDGTAESPYPTLSDALPVDCNSKNLTFVLVSNEIAYNFFQTLPIDCSITITTLLYILYFFLLKVDLGIKNNHCSLPMAIYIYLILDF